MSVYRTNGPLVIVVVILGHNLDNSQVSIYRTIGPTLVLLYASNLFRFFAHAFSARAILIAHTAFD